MSVTAKLDDSQYQAAMERYVRDFGKSANEVVTNQHKLLVQEAVKALPPKNKKQGGDAIERSLRNAASPLDQAKWNSPRIKSLIASENINSIESVFQKIPNKRGVKVRNFNPMLHTSARVRGKVKKSQRVAATNKGAWNKYLKSLKKRSGSLKGSITAGLSSLGGKAAGWITKHSNKGRLIDGRKGKNPKLTTESKIDYSSSYNWAIKGLGPARKRKALGDLKRQAKLAAQKNRL